jgi:hypothetical protein
MQSEEQKIQNLENLKLDSLSDAALVPVEAPTEEVSDEKNKNKKAAVAAAAAGIVSAAAGTALGAQNADAIAALMNFGNDEPVAVQPDPDPNAPANVTEPAAQTEVPAVEPLAEAPTVAETQEVTNDTELIPVDINNDGNADVVVLDANQDGVVEAMGIDQSNDGTIDTIYVDTDNDGDMDQIMIDENQDGNPDFEGALEEEITLQLTPEAAAPATEAPVDEAPVADDNLAATPPQDEFDPNADVSEWA